MRTHPSANVTRLERSIVETERARTRQTSRRRTAGAPKSFPAGNIQRGGESCPLAIRPEHLRVNKSI
ncbi:MAG: hypothetical protein ABR577_17755 [Pyrinomonadaceae bacterium]